MKFQIEQAVEILAKTPATVKSLLGDLSDDWTRGEENKNDWSAFDIVGHLIHADETDWMPRARIILARGENPAFEPFDRYGQFEKSAGKTLNELLDAFALVRRQSLDALRALNLTAEHLKLTAAHPELGAVTLEQLLSTWTVHDLTHVRQIAAVLARKYSANVGAWKQYLSILQ
jgi:uncharacterized damage-inducible protein DinB